MEVTQTDPILERLGSAWCGWAGKHWLITHLVLLGMVVLSLIPLSRSRIDADWLHLFRSDDPVLLQYQRYAHQGRNMRSLYLRLGARAAKDPGPALDALGNLPSLERVQSLQPLPYPTGEAWYLLLIRADTPMGMRAQVLQQIHDCLKTKGIDYGLTGAEQIMWEFRQSVNRDFVRASLLSVILVTAVLGLVLGLCPALIAGLVYEVAGLVIALGVCVALGGELNMLSAAVPCVLVGLGADFVIHALAAGSDAGTTGPRGTGRRIYGTIARPMFWGALTTAGAFASLALADLRGLAHVGMLGCIGVMCMFAVVMAFLPPLLERWPQRFRRCPAPCWIPTTSRPRLLAGLALGACSLGISVFSLQLKSEERLENLYDAAMPSLQLQRALAARLGRYPSVLYAVVDTSNPVATRRDLQAGHYAFDVDPMHTATAVDDLRSPLVIPLMAHQNPFAPDHYATLERSLQTLTRRPGIRGAFITGDATLSLHMNRLLQRGMVRALGIVFVFLALALVISLRSWKLVLAPLVTLALSIAGILGCMGLLGITLSAYTLTLIPVFVGIGVDDLLFVAHAFRAGRPLYRAPSVALAVTLTTGTTVLGYGSLLAARNAGFRAMGLCAAVGLTVMYAGAVYLLPLLLGDVPRSSLSPSPGTLPGPNSEYPVSDRT